MKKNQLNIVLTALFLSFAAHAQVLCKWDAESTRNVPARFDCFRGETLVFAPTYRQYNTLVTNVTETLYWQTNGMLNTWWTTNVLQFTPAMDVGASSYTAFIRAVGTNGVSYRANGIITMKHAPGFTPNALALPVQTIDFATVTASNAPWVLPSALANSNNWDTAYSWGEHAGLYRLINWVPSWSELTGKPLIFPPEPHDYASITNPPWITASQVPAYDNTKIVSVDSNHFVRITATNLVMCEIATSNSWSIAFDGTDIYNNLPLPYPLVNEYTLVVLEGEDINAYTFEYYDFAQATVSANGWYYYSNTPIDPYTGVSMINPQWSGGNYLEALLHVTQIVTTNAIKTFATTADLNAYCKTNHIGDVTISGSLTAGTVISIGQVSAPSYLFLTNYVATGSEATGTVYWDVDEQSLAFKTAVSSTSLTWGGEISTYSRNNESFTLTNGVPVYIVKGGSGPTKRVGLASCADASKDGFFGLVTVDAGIAQNGFGFVTSFGRVKGLNTSAYEEGDELWLCNGALTNGMPTTTNDLWMVGYCEYKHANQGVIFVNPAKNGFAKSWQLTEHENTSLASGAHGGLPTAAQVGAVGTNDVFRGSVSNSMYKTRLNYQGSAMATYIGFNAFPEWDERTSINGPVRILNDAGSTLGFLDISANFGSGKFGGGAPFGGIERLNYLYYDYDGAIFQQSDITSGNYVNLIRAGGDSFISGKMSFSNNVFVTKTINVSNLVYSTVRWIDAIAAGNTLGGGSTSPQRTEVYAGSGIFAYGYDTTDDSNFSIQCVHGLASTNATFQNLYYSPHAHVSVAALTPPATNATFVLKWQVASVTGTYDGYHVKTQTVYFANSHTNFHRLLDFGVYTNNSLEGRDSVMFRGNISRIVGVGDTGNRVIIDSLDYHVPIDTVGSTLINGD